MKDVPTSSHTIRLRQTDAAGVLYFAAVFEIMHAVYEDWLASIGLDISMLVRGDVLLPITHAEADHLRPLGPGDRVTVSLTARKIDATRFRTDHVLRDAEGRTAARGHMIHTAVRRTDRRRTSLPPILASHLLDQDKGASDPDSRRA